ncbi:hypothetical protein IWQ62_000914 [Dispira parvispora]|uniref:Uncharacterized protein n=1 Tax=Dispira parvispora TaxID=1520584 RepID=A0A9W8AW51_9FUNG|nr:hypothetical protein IWQ62_000914 [Dispira parvispora]
MWQWAALGLTVAVAGSYLYCTRTSSSSSSHRPPKNPQRREPNLSNAPPTKGAGKKPKKARRGRRGNTIQDQPNVVSASAESTKANNSSPPTAIDNSQTLNSDADHSTQSTDKKSSASQTNRKSDKRNRSKKTKHQPLTNPQSRPPKTVFTSVRGRNVQQLLNSSEDSTASTEGSDNEESLLAHPDDNVVSKKPPVRVLRVVPTTQRPLQRAARTFTETTSREPPPLTKRQKQRLRQKEARQEDKRAMDALQEERLRQHRRSRMEHQVRESMLRDQKKRNPRPTSINYWGPQPSTASSQPAKSSPGRSNGDSQKQPPTYRGQLIWDE